MLSRVAERCPVSPLLRTLYAVLLLAVLGLALIPDASESGAWYAAPRFIVASILVAFLVVTQVAFAYDMLSYLRQRGASLAGRRGDDGRY